MWRVACPPLELVTVTQGRVLFAAVKRIVLTLVCVAIALPAIAGAAAPRKGGHYTGKSTPLVGSKRHTVSIRVSSDGKSGTLRYC
jgi:hypothetical protein